ncbi:MAG: prephenate dehydratase [Bacillota bacterium]|nr:prephenate dehydratase [Bacillota bacterium]
MAKVVYLGPSGTFTEAAARAAFPDPHHRFVELSSVPDVLEAAEADSDVYGVVPVENSIEGSVTLTLDWLIHHVNVPIVAEWVLPVRQHLLAAEQTARLGFDAVEVVLSHPHAIAQCREFLRRQLPGAQIRYTSSTAEAARLVAEHPDCPWVAVGTRLAAERYGLAVLAGPIQDFAHNETRFFVVGQSAYPYQGARVKTTLLITLPHDYPGALYQVLAAFAWRKLNLTRIESRPTRRGLGSYHFMIDVERPLGDVLLPGAIAEIQALGCAVRVLGSYPCFTAGDEGVRTAVDVSSSSSYNEPKS